MVIGDWLAKRAALTPDKTALIDREDNNRAVNFATWNASANQTAHLLQQRYGIGKGDRVAVLASNSLGYLDVWFALGKLGGVLQNINWRLSVREITILIQDAEPTVLLYSGEFADMVNTMRADMHSVKHYVAFDSLAANGDDAFTLRDRYPATPPAPVELAWDDPWVICYTGGTTGTPKGALLTHRSITANAVNTIVSWGLDANDVTILDAPLFHAGGMSVFTAPLAYLGGTSIVCRGFDTDAVFDLIASQPVTLYFGVPTVFLMLQQHPRWQYADFGKLKLVISGGAPCPLPVFDAFWARDVDFKQGYGLTEAGPNTFWLPPADVRRKPASVGFPLMHIDVRVVDEAGHQAEPDSVGELVIRGPHVCGGYWRNEAATTAAIHPLPGDPDGPAWLHTGDLAYRDADGYYYVVGRLKEMFISGGENIYPAEIESVIHSHPDVSEAAVIGIPHGKWGEVGRAIVVRKPDATVDAEALLAFIRDNIAKYKVPKTVVFADALPKTGANKVDRQALKRSYGNPTL